jgi:hypothetical protein
MRWDTTEGRKHWTMVELERAARREPGLDKLSRETVRRMKENCLKPWRFVMWCVGELTLEYRQRMYALLDLHARPFDAREPVVCNDEKSLQLLKHSRAALPMTLQAPAKIDDEYVRSGTANLFVAVEPKAGHRAVSVTQRRGKTNFVEFLASMLTGTYTAARRVHIVADNLNFTRE